VNFHANPRDPQKVSPPLLSALPSLQSHGYHRRTLVGIALLGGGSWQRDELLRSHRPPATALANISSRWIPTNHREHLLSPSYVQVTRCAIEPSFCFELWSYMPLVFFKAVWISLIAD